MLTLIGLLSIFFCLGIVVGIILTAVFRQPKGKCPQPNVRRYSIMSDYAIPNNTPDGRVTFRLSATDEEGEPITDPAKFADLVFEATSSNDAAFSVALDADQPNPMVRVGGYHVGASGQAAVTGNLKKANGDLIATGVDGFTVTVGEIALGSVRAEFEGLTPIG